MNDKNKEKGRYFKPYQSKVILRCSWTRRLPTKVETLSSVFKDPGTTVDRFHQHFMSSFCANQFKLLFLAYGKGGQTFLFAGRILKLFFIEGLKEEISEGCSLAVSGIEDKSWVKPPLVCISRVVHNFVSVSEGHLLCQALCDWSIWALFTPKGW